MLTRILDLTFHKQDEGFKLDVCDRGTPELLTSNHLSFQPFFLNPLELKQLDFDSKDAAARLERLRDYGRKLYLQVFTPDIRKVWLEHKACSEFLVLCIRNAPDAKELETIAWETLFDGEEFIAAGTKTTISRLPLDVSPRVPLPALSLPLKMLALVSSPLDLPDHSRLQIEREQEILLEAINDPAGHGRVLADFEDEAKLEILESSLDTRYQIFHFTGHGIAPEDGGGLLLEDGMGKSRPVSAGEILQFLRRNEDSLRLVVLSGCQTARTLNVGGFADVARGLLRGRIPAVIATQFSISDDGAMKFAESLYSKIAAGRSLELASHAARRSLLRSDNYYLQCDALALVLLTSNGECLQTTQVESPTAPESPTIDFSFYLPLPQLGHGFYGRRKEYREVRDGIIRNNQRAVIIHGIGGIGKTALVSHVGTRLKKYFQGVYAFDCTSGTLTPETVMIKLHQFLATQGVNSLEQLLYQNLEPELLATRLGQTLSKWRLLLIFDNFESQLERADSGFRIADENLRKFITLLIKTTAERSHFLFTSRYLFELDDKRLGNVQSLPLEDLGRPEALSLMQKLQHLTTAGYLEKLKALEIFGGHPYAVVTLDRYCSHQPLRQALEESQAIHGTLREFLAIDLNYVQLSERSRELLNRLAAFKHSVPYEAAEWAIGEKVPYETETLEGLFIKARDGWPKEWEGHFVEADMRRMIEEALPDRRRAEDLIRPIRELIDWGLLTPAHEDGQLKRLSVHTLVREFCRDKQSHETWRESLRDAAAFYTNSLKLSSHEKAQAEIWTEMEAFELLMDAEDFNDAAALLFDAERLLIRWGFGHYMEGQYARLTNKLDAAGTATLLNSLGSLVLGRGERDKAMEYFNRSLKICQEVGNRPLMAGPLAQIANIHEKRRDHDQAMKYYEQALTISEESHDYSSVSSTLHQIGMIHEELGEFEKASEYYQRSMRISGGRGDRANFAVSLRQAGVLMNKSDYDDEEALKSYHESLEIFEELNHRADIATTLNLIGDVYLKTGQLEKASEYYVRSLRIREELGSRLEIAALLQAIATIHEKQGTYDKALEYSQRSLSIREDLGDRTGILTSLHRIAMIQEKLGNVPKALDYYNRSLKIADDFGNPKERTLPLMQIGLIFHRQEKFDKAWDCYDRSIRMLKEGDYPSGLGYALHLRGMLFISLGRYQEAFVDLLSSWKLFTDLESSDAKGPVGMLKLLRTEWGERNFAAQWKKAMGEDVPEWLKE